MRSNDLGKQKFSLSRSISDFCLEMKKRSRYRERLRDSERERFFQHSMLALSVNGISGDYAEFGCWGGVTFKFAHKHARKNFMTNKLWAFDSFCGLPPINVPEDEHPAWRQGAMSMGVEAFRKACAKNRIPDDEYEIVKGFYSQSLANPLDARLPTDICLAYLDCDLYSSTVDVLTFLTPRLKHGMIIAFDDYYCWTSTQVSGERKACAEFFRASNEWTLVPYIQYGWHGMSFLLESKELGGDCSVSY